jgi:methylated-DNA-[protein]-cysteine S-methyltransferase
MQTQLTRESSTETLAYTLVDSPVGPLLLAGDERGLWLLSFVGKSAEVQPSVAWKTSESPFQEVKRQLTAYFARELRRFEVPLHLVGTEFQLAVWNALTLIPYGTTLSYSQLAHAIGKPAAVRAVGGANHANPVAIIVPCHRVIGSNGKLVGYGGGLEVKDRLLALERAELITPV